MLNEQGKYITDHTKIANSLANNFREISSDKYKSIEFINHKNRQECNTPQEIQLNNTTL